MSILNLRLLLLCTKITGYVGVRFRDCMIKHFVLSLLPVQVAFYKTYIIKTDVDCLTAHMPAGIFMLLGLQIPSF